MRKHSKKRDAILKALRSTDSHPGAQVLYGALREEYPDLSLATVYRNLREFHQEGLAASLGVVAGEERFDGRVEGHPHFVCRSCGKVFDYSPRDMEKLRSLADNEEGYVIDSQRTVFYGLCKECAEKR